MILIHGKFYHLNAMASHSSQNSGRDLAKVGAYLSSQGTDGIRLATRRPRSRGNPQALVLAHDRRVFAVLNLPPGDAQGMPSGRL
jgi:hypothetical protein